MRPPQFLHADDAIAFQDEDVNRSAVALVTAALAGVAAGAGGFTFV